MVAVCFCLIYGFFKKKLYKVEKRYIYEKVQNIVMSR